MNNEEEIRRVLRPIGRGQPPLGCDQQGRYPQAAEPCVDLEATLAQQAAPQQAQRCRAELRSDGDYLCDCKAGACPGRSAEPAQQANHLTIERLRDALVASRIIDPAAVEDPDGYDDGVTLHRIEALHRRLT